MIRFLIAFILLWRSDVLLRKYGTTEASNRLFQDVEKWSFLLTRFRIRSNDVENIVSKAKVAQMLYPRKTECLPRSLALCSMLLLYGIKANMLVGVRVDPPRSFHAWVEIDKNPITDDKERIFEYKAFFKLPSKEI